MTIRTSGNFQAALRDRSRAIHICQQVANGSKHMTITRHPDPDVQAKMQWESEYGRAGTMRAGDPLAMHRYRLVIFDKGTERSAADVFEEALRDWQRLLGTWGFVEGNARAGG